MDLLLTVGAYALWFVIQTLVYMYIACVTGVGLAYGCHITKSVIKSREMKRIEGKMDEEDMLAGAAATA